MSCPTKTRFNGKAASVGPFDLLVIGHTNEDIRRFARTYLLRIKERKDDLEAERALTDIMQTDLLQSAEIARLTAQIEGLYANEHAWSEKEKALHDAKDALLRAKQLTAYKMDLWKHARVTTHTIRYLNRVFVAIMEGDLKPWPGDERFSEFLIDCARHSSWVPWRYVELLCLYLSLVYGDPNKSREIPFAFAKARGIFSDTVALLTYQAREKTEKTRDDYRKSYIKDRLRSFFRDQEYEQQILKQKREERAKEAVEVLHEVKQHSMISPQVVYVNFIWLRAYSDIQHLVAPYCTKEFEYRWKRVYASFDHLSFDRVFSKLKESFILPKFQRWSYHQFLDLGVVNDLLSFLTEDREGAFVVLAMIDVARFGSWKRERHEIETYGKKFYPNISMSDFPGIADTDPIETLRVIKALSELMQLKQTDDAFTNTFLRYFRIPGYYIRKPDIEGRFRRFIAKEVFMKEKFLSDLRETGNFPAFRSIGFEFKFDVEEKREKVKLLKTSLQEQWDFFSRNNPAAASYWNHCDDFTRTYLLGRATDLVEYGECVANVSFPQPTFVGAGELVSALVSLLTNVETRLAQAEERKAAEEYQSLIEKTCAEKMAKISFDSPDHLPPRVLSDTDRDMLKAVLLNELSEGKQRRWDVQHTLAVIDEFARFCWLLSLPENHIYAPSGQYTKRLVPSRTVKDMTDEMAQELGSLPLHTAYAKVLQEQDGRQTVLKRKIHPLPPLPTGKEDHSAVEHEAIQRTHAKHSRERDLIEEELRYRQEAWRKAEAERTKQRAQKQEHPFRPKAPGAEEPPPGQS